MRTNCVLFLLCLITQVLNSGGLYIDKNKFTDKIHDLSDRTRREAPDPAQDPSSDPAQDPSSDPAQDPSSDPAQDPSSDPSSDPTQDPSSDPTSDYQQHPDAGHSGEPTLSEFHPVGEMTPADHAESQQDPSHSESHPPGEAAHSDTTPSGDTTQTESNPSGETTHTDHPPATGHNPLFMTRPGEAPPMFMRQVQGPPPENSVDMRESHPPQLSQLSRPLGLPEYTNRRLPMALPQTQTEQSHSDTAPFGDTVRQDGSEGGKSAGEVTVDTPIALPLVQSGERGVPRPDPAGIPVPMMQIQGTTTASKTTGQGTAWSGQRPPPRHNQRPRGRGGPFDTGPGQRGSLGGDVLATAAILGADMHDGMELMAQRRALDHLTGRGAGAPRNDTSGRGPPAHDVYDYGRDYRGYPYDYRYDPRYEQRYDYQRSGQFPSEQKFKSQGSAGAASGAGAAAGRGRDYQYPPLREYRPYYGNDRYPERRQEDYNPGYNLDINLGQYRNPCTNLSDPACIMQARYDRPEMDIETRYGELDIEPDEMDIEGAPAAALLRRLGFPQIPGTSAIHQEININQNVLNALRSRFGINTTADMQRKSSDPEFRSFMYKVLSQSQQLATGEYQANLTQAEVQSLLTNLGPVNPRQANSPEATHLLRNLPNAELNQTVSSSSNPGTEAVLTIDGPPNTLAGLGIAGLGAAGLGAGGFGAGGLSQAGILQTLFGQPGMAAPLVGGAAAAAGAGAVEGTPGAGGEKVAQAGTVAALVQGEPREAAEGKNKTREAGEARENEKAEKKATTKLTSNATTATTQLEGNQTTLVGQLSPTQKTEIIATSPPREKSEAGKGKINAKDHQGKGHQPESARQGQTSKTDNTNTAVAGGTVAAAEAGAGAAQKAGASGTGTAVKAQGALSGSNGANTGASGQSGVASSGSAGGNSGAPSGANTGVGGANTGVGGANTGVGGANAGVGGANTGVGGANAGVGGANTGVGGAKTSGGAGTGAGTGAVGPATNDVVKAGLETLPKNQVPVVVKPSYAPTKAAFGIVAAVLIGFIIIVGPLLCLLCRLRDRVAKKKKKEMSLKNRDISANSITEAMVLNDLGHEQPMLVANEAEQALRSHEREYTDLDLSTDIEFRHSPYGSSASHLP